MKYKGKYSVSSFAKLKGKRPMVAALALALILVCTVGGTLAYVFTHSGSVTNTFQPTQVTCTVKETFDGNTKRNVYVQNGDQVKAYIRVAVIVNWKNNETGALVPAASDEYEVKYTANWKQNGAYWYYPVAVEAGGATDVLISACKPLVTKEGHSLFVQILASAVQAEPANVVTSTWGVDPTTLS